MLPYFYRPSRWSSFSLGLSPPRFIPTLWYMVWYRTHLHTSNGRFILEHVPILSRAVVIVSMIIILRDREARYLRTTKVLRVVG